VLRQGVVEVLTGGVPAAKVAPLLSERAVTIRSDIGAARDLVESCPELARVVTLSCSSSGLAEAASASGRARRHRPADLHGVHPTDGTTAAENRVRTQAANLVPNAIIHTQQDRIDTDAFFFGSLEQLQRLAWYFVLLVAACSLTVGMLAGVIERRRPFALLARVRPPPRELRQIVFLETAAGDAGHRGGGCGARYGVVVMPLSPVQTTWREAVAGSSGCLRRLHGRQSACSAALIPSTSGPRPPSWTPRREHDDQTGNE
jgi:hypothetical protein